MIIVGLVLWAVFGINPLTFLGLGDLTNVMPAQTQTERSAPLNDDQTQFIRTVLADNEDVWNAVFAQNGLTYQEPQLTLFRDQVNSACGFASSASGPFYCPGDNNIYIDLGFFEELARRFEAPGDFAQAYVVAHEVGHHVQNLIGVLPRFNAERRNLSKAEANKKSIQVELQADCFAGIWGFYTAQNNYLERGDLQEALNAAMQIGDDAIQLRTRGYVVPESFNHGTSEQRQYWFRRGFEGGRMQDCDTMSGGL